MKNNWTIEKENPKLRDKLAKSLQISPITAQILVNRGIENETEANLFLNCTLFDLPSPYLMKGMDRAVRCGGRDLPGHRTGSEDERHRGLRDASGAWSSPRLINRTPKQFGAIMISNGPTR